MSFKKIIKTFLPAFVWNYMHKQRELNTIRSYQKGYQKVINRLQKKQGSIRACFLAIYSSNWKYDSVFRQMLSDSLFEPIVVICPVVNRGRYHMIESMAECVSYFKGKNYPYICTYDDKTDTFINADSLKADIVFYTNPYKGLIHDNYYIDKFKDSLTCYVNYGFINVSYKWAVSEMFHQCLWRYFVECDDNRKLVKLYSLIGDKNVAVTGYPMYDAFLYGSSFGIDWKDNNKKFKRIIWAPHHSIPSNDTGDVNVHFSTFLLYSDFILILAEKYKDSIQFVFKPHPLLKSILYDRKDWGKEKTDEYYKKWENGINTAITNGEYVDLFNSSDAMIHDCASFTIEYLYTKKPVLFLANYNRESESNAVSLKAYKCHYLAKTDNEIENFIEEVVLKDNDPMLKDREQFFNDILLPPNRCNVANNIINEIKKSLGRI